MSMIKTAGVCKTFKHPKNKSRLEVLKNISVTVEKNEVVCIIGPSGAGKTTFLRILSRLETFDEGQVYIEDRLLFDCHNGYNREKTAKDERNRIILDVGMVFQSFKLFPHLTALENVMLAPVNVRKLSKDEAFEKSKSVLERIGLGGKLDAYPSQLSGGQQQRVAIARALAMEPKIMLFDEPTSSLDPVLAGEVLAVMRQLAGEGMTMLVVSHELGFVREAADRILFMYEGCILESGMPEQIFTDPQNNCTKQFLGIKG